MTSSLYSRGSRLLWAGAAPVGLWTIFIIMGVIPDFQRHLLYMHKVLPFWEDANKPQQWGFAKNQVTPFFLTTEDGEKIHAWHILPLPLYHKHEAALRDQPTGLSHDFTTTESFRILKEDPTSQLVVYLHGNAGHLPNTIRAPSFHTLTGTSNYHVLAIDYRGFGKSTGVPSEEGLILDASAAVEFALKKAGLSPNQIVILGQSLGTAVAAGVTERYARVHAVDFAGVVLVAGFSSLPNMLSGYAIAGWIPILKPLQPFPWLMKWALTFIEDKWATDNRLRSWVDVVHRNKGRHLRLSLIHAADDWDIPAHEDDKLFAAAVKPLLSKRSGSEVSADDFATLKESHTTHIGEDAYVTEFRDGNITVRQELFPYGGHNKIMQLPPVLLAIMSTFEEAQRQEA